MRKFLLLTFWFVFANNIWAQTNLLTNPGAESNYDGWVKTDNDVCKWGISTESPHSGLSCWVGSFRPCSLAQTIDLTTNYSVTQLDAAPEIHAGVYVFTGASHSGTITFMVELLGSTDNVLSTKYASNNEFIADNTPWTLKFVTITNYGTGLRKIRITLISDGTKDWAGQYAPAFDDAYVKLNTSGVIFNVSSTSSTIGASEGSTSTISITSNRAWTCSSNQSWLTVAPSSGSNNGTLTFKASANPKGYKREAEVTITTPNYNPKIIKVTQNAGSISLSVSPTSVDVTSDDKSNAAIVVSSNASWTASSNQTWLTITPTTGIDNSTIIATAAQNTTGSSRSATITVTASSISRTINITQTTNSATLEVSTTTATIGALAGNTATASVTSNSTWIASSNSSWLTVTPSNNGSGTLTMTATKNQTLYPRYAKVTVSVCNGLISNSIDVTQEAIPAELSVTPATATVSADGETINLNVESNLSWTANSALWIALNLPSSNSGDKVVSPIISANPFPYSRTGTIIFKASGVSIQDVEILVMH